MVGGSVNNLSTKSDHAHFNTDLAKKSLACLEYVLVHELAHLIEPTHSDLFRAILSRHLPDWPQLRNQLNRAPLAHEDWEY